MAKATRGRKPNKPRRRRTRARIARVVADEVGEDVYTVKAVIAAYQSYLIDTLVANGNALINDVVDLRLCRRICVDLHTKKRARVPVLYARLARRVKERIRMSDDMEKMGVDTSVDQERLEKKASKGCPRCGGNVAVHGRVLVCPKCGTEPFERTNHGG